MSNKITFFFCNCNPILIDIRIYSVLIVRMTGRTIWCLFSFPSEYCHTRTKIPSLLKGMSLCQFSRGSIFILRDLGNNRLGCGQQGSHSSGICNSGSHDLFRLMIPFLIMLMYLCIVFHISCRKLDIGLFHASVASNGLSGHSQCRLYDIDSGVLVFVRSL